MPVPQTTARTAAVHHGGTHVAHVLTVAERNVVGTVERDRVGVLLYRDGLAGKGGLLDLHGSALEHAAVGGNRVAGLKQHDVAGHELAGVQRDLLAIADDLGLGGTHLLKSGERLFALGLLDHAEGGVDDHDRHDDNHVGPLGLALDHAGYGRDDGRDDEHDDHGVGHLLEEANPQRGLLFLLELVGAELRRARLRLGRG